MRNPPIAGVCSLLLTVALSQAQSTLVIPAGIASTPAAATTSWPFGLNSACRIQYLYDAVSTGIAGAIVIKALEVRAQENATNAAKSNINIQIELSTTAVTSVAPSTTFASNRGANHAIAYARKPTSINATTPGFIGGYSGPMVFDTPFLYLPANGNLLIEYDVASQPSTTWSIDCVTGALAVHAAIGTGCNGLVSGSSGGILGQTLTWTLTGGAPNAPAALLLGASELATPFPVPGNPTCLVYQDFPVVLSTGLTASGTGSLLLPVPANPLLRGQAIYGQYAALNAARIDTSATRRTLLGATWGVTRISAEFSNVTLTGTVQQYVALVTRLHY